MNLRTFIVLVMLFLSGSSFWIAFQSGTSAWIASGLLLAVLTVLAGVPDVIHKFGLSGFGLEASVETHAPQSDAPNDADEDQDDETRFDVFIRAMDVFLERLRARWHNLAVHDDTEQGRQYLRQMTAYLAGMIEGYGHHASNPIRQALSAVQKDFANVVEADVVIDGTGRPALWQRTIILCDQLEDFVAIMKKQGPPLEMERLSLSSEETESLSDTPEKVTPSPVSSTDRIPIVTFSDHIFFDVFVRVSEYDPQNDLYHEATEWLRRGDLPTDIPKEVAVRIGEAIHEWVASGFAALGRYGPGIVRGEKKDAAIARLHHAAYDNLLDGRVIDLEKDGTLNSACERLTQDVESWVNLRNLGPVRIFVSASNDCCF